MLKVKYNLGKIRELRMKHDFTKSKIAKYLELTLNGYSMKERGKRKFTLDEAKVLADLFELSIEDLFFYNVGNQNEDGKDHSE